MKLNIACGKHKLQGWVNADLPRVDLRKRLPYGDNSVECILCEHTIEHLSSAEAVNALQEFRRILKPGGFLLLVFPDVTRGGLPADAVLAIATKWGHKTLWTADVAIALGLAVGFWLPLEPPPVELLAAPGHHLHCKNPDSLAQTETRVLLRKPLQ